MKDSHNDRAKKSLRSIAAFGIIAAIFATAIPLGTTELRADVTGNDNPDYEDYDSESGDLEGDDDIGDDDVGGENDPDEDISLEDDDVGEEEDPTNEDSSLEDDDVEDEFNFEDEDFSEYELEGWDSYDDFDELINDDIQFMSQVIEDIKAFAAELKSEDISDKHVVKAIEGLDKLVIKSTRLLDKMTDEVSSGDFDLDNMWDKMDRITNASDKLMDVIDRYFDENPGVLEGLSEESMKDFEDGFSMDDFGADLEDDFSSLYGDFDEDFFGDLEKDELRKIMKSFSGDDMGLIQKQIKSGESDLMKKMFEDFDVNEDKAQKLVKNYVSVLEAIGVDSDSDLPVSLRGLYFRTVDSVISTKTAKDMVGVWKRAMAAVEAGETDFSKYVEKLEKLLDQNEQELIYGDDAVEFADVSYEGDEWYRDFVFEGRGEYWDGYSGDRKGEFGPSDDVTFAEILKMAMESANIEVSGTDADNSGKWFEAYVATAKRNGYSFVDRVSDWNSAAKRSDVAVIIAEIHGLAAETYLNVYSDVDASNEDAGFLQAVYDAGFMTGKSAGIFDAKAKINRAEAAKVIIEAAKYSASEQFVDELE